MAQPTSNAKIEELRFRVKTDPKSRLFFPLAEELRKVGNFDEAEQVLRAGLEHHPSYLSGWVSLGRVLREAKNDSAATEALNKALQIDPGNVVAARILADAYLALGEKVEAIKKYKLAHALLPADEELEETIARLEAELNPAAAGPEPSPEDAFAPLPSSAEAGGQPHFVGTAEESEPPAFGLVVPEGSPLAPEAVDESEPDLSPFAPEPVAESASEASPFAREDVEETAPEEKSFEGEDTLRMRPESEQRAFGVAPESFDQAAEGGAVSAADEPFGISEAPPLDERPLDGTAGEAPPEPAFGLPSADDGSAFAEPHRQDLDADDSPFAAQPPPAAEPVAPDVNGLDLAGGEASAEASPWATDDARLLSEASQSLARQQQIAGETGDAEPMSAAHAESPFEEPAGDRAYSSAAFDVEAPQGMHIERAPLEAELPAPLEEELPPLESAPVGAEPPFPSPPPEDEADVFAPAEAPPQGAPDLEPAPSEREDFTATLTMADLYARQGLVDDARQIYEKILQREPGNDDVRRKLAALGGAPAAAPGDTADAKIRKLEGWLQKVGRREVGDV